MDAKIVHVLGIIVRIYFEFIMMPSNAFASALVVQWNSSCVFILSICACRLLPDMWLIDIISRCRYARLKAHFKTSYAFLPSFIQPPTGRD